MFSNCLFIDPDHQRAKGNVKYFEFQLEKLKKSTEDDADTQKEREKRETPEKKKKKKVSKKAFSLIPERKKYEMLCRGEGIKMVRKQTHTHTQNYGSLLTNLLSISLSFRRRAVRADCFAVTTTTTAIPNSCWHRSNSKTNGTAPTSFATSTSSQTLKLRKSSSWQNLE